MNTTTVGSLSVGDVFECEGSTFVVLGIARTPGSRIVTLTVIEKGKDVSGPGPHVADVRASVNSMVNVPA